MWRCHGDELSEQCYGSSMDLVQTTSAERSLVTGHLSRDVSSYIQKYNTYPGGEATNVPSCLLSSLALA